MAFTVTLYHFAKKKNSTLQPSGSGVELNCELKQPTSYKNPVFTFFVEDGFSWNYLQWDDWYYFIEDVVSVRNDLFEVHCSLDVLATYKAEIGATSAFVLYDTTANTEIIDTRLSQKTTAIQTYSSSAPVFTLGNCILLGIVGDGGVGIYSVSQATANNILNSINNWLDDPSLRLPVPSLDNVFDTPKWMSYIAHNVTTGIRLLLTTGKASDCIKSSILLPVSDSEFTGSGKQIYLGKYPTGESGKFISSAAIATNTVTIAIPWQSADWRRNDRYTKIYLSLPYVGIVSYPASQLIGVTSLSVTYSISVNGNIVVQVAAGSLGRIGTYGGNCSSNYMIGASNINPWGVVGSSVAAAAAGAGVIASASPVGAVASGAAGIVGMLTAAAGLPMTVGTCGGGANTDGWTVTCTVVYHDTNVTPDSVSAAIGTPTMSVKTIGTLSGFVQTREASVNAACYDDVRAEINALMDGGFFYE